MTNQRFRLVLHLGFALKYIFPVYLLARARDHYAVYIFDKAAFFNGGKVSSHRHLGNFQHLRNVPGGGNNPAGSAGIQCAGSRAMEHRATAGGVDRAIPDRKQ